MLGLRARQAASASNSGASAKRDPDVAMVARMPMSDDAPDMSGDLPVIILLLGATIVPWFLHAFASGDRDPDPDDMEPGPLRTATPVSQGKQEEPDDTFRSHGLLQLRPDGTVLVWRDEPAIPGPSGFSVTPVTDTTAPG